jgi:hypothetical protein
MEQITSGKTEAIAPSAVWLSSEIELDRLREAVRAILNNQFDPDRVNKLVGLILSEREKKAHPPTT